jgi:hypothetical protein
MGASTMPPPAFPEELLLFPFTISYNSRDDKKLRHKSNHSHQHLQSHQPHIHHSFNSNKGISIPLCSSSYLAELHGLVLATDEAIEQDISNSNLALFWIARQF